MSLGRALKSCFWLVLAVVPATFGWACNNLLNIDEGRLACVHTSECPVSQVCLYERCSPECRGDRDCPDGQECTQTDFGPHCVQDSSLLCQGDDDCEGGATCDPEMGCRYPCSTSSQCVDGQRCEGGHCVGSQGTGGSGVGGSGVGGSAGGGGEGGAEPTTSGSVGGTAGSGGTGDKPCEEDKLRCPLQAAAEREVCKNGEWEPTGACDSGTVCDRNSNGKCVALVDECLGKSAGAAYCNGSTRLVCSNDLVSVTSESCDSAAHCAQATGPDCAVCLEGEYTCDGDVLKRCNAEHTDYTEAETCSDAPCNALLGECTERVCDASAYYCDAASNTLSHCNEDGTGFDADPVDCGSGICDAEGGQCDECQAGTVLGCFDGETQQVCDDEGQGAITVACADVDPDTPICVGEGNCVECEPLSAECLDVHQIQRCSAEGKLEAPKTCVDQACVDDSCVGECSPGDTDCADDSDVTTCKNDGTWGDPVSCSGQACVGAGCTGQCQPKATQCADKFSRQECTSAGSWDNAVTCTGQACANGNCVGVCVPETKRCNNGKVETCSDQGAWANPVTCTDQTCVESGTTASCQGVCAPDYQRCNSNNVQNCNASGSYSGTAANCTNAGQTCVASGDTAMCQGSCAPGYQRCNNNNVQNCNASGSYSGTADNCTTKGNTCVVSGTSAACTGVCIEGMEQCTSNTPQTCDNKGAWQSGSACSSPDFICEVNGGDASCVANPPYSVGYPDAFTATSSVGTNFILGNPVTLTSKVRVLQFGLIAATQNSCRVHMLLYTDNSGSPGNLVGFSAEVTPNIASGRHELAPSGQIVVNPGRYWLMAQYNCAATILAFDDNSAPDLKYAVVSYGSAPDPFPTTGVATITTFAANHYLNVQNAP